MRIIAALAIRIGKLLLGLLLAAAGYVLFASMCGSNTHLDGAWLGSLGGVLIGLHRRTPRPRLLTTAAGVCGSVAGTLLELIGSGSCAGLITSLAAGVTIGFGLGLAAEAVFRATGRGEVAVRNANWDAIREEHQRSIENFIARAEAIPDSAWEEACAAAKWSPAQIAEHLRLTYAVIGDELAGGTGIRIRTSWWQRQLLRFKALPMILSQGTIPRAVLAPREIRPGSGPFPSPQVLAALRAGARSAEAVLTTQQGGRNGGITHHVFGRLRPAEALRFATVHNNHHTAQLPREQ